jgi:hypothetical protein
VHCIVLRHCLSYQIYAMIYLSPSIYPLLTRSLLSTILYVLVIYNVSDKSNCYWYIYIYYVITTFCLYLCLCVGACWCVVFCIIFGQFDYFIVFVSFVLDNKSRCHRVCQLWDTGACAGWGPRSDTCSDTATCNFKR